MDLGTALMIVIPVIYIELECKDSGAVCPDLGADVGAISWNAHLYLRRSFKRGSVFDQRKEFGRNLEVMLQRTFASLDDRVGEAVIVPRVRVINGTSLG